MRSPDGNRPWFIAKGMPRRGVGLDWSCLCALGRCHAKSTGPETPITAVSTRRSATALTSDGNELRCEVGT